MRKYFTALHLYIYTAIFLLLPVAGNAQWGAFVPNPIMEYQYTYDNVGNITDIYDAVTVSTSTFTYDEIDRLTSATGPYGSQNYTYDSIGNIQGVTDPTKDLNGNAINYDNKTIDYDYDNRPIKITDTTKNTVTEFAYDYSGQRVYKKVSSGTLTSEDYYVGNIYEESYSVDSSSPIISASTTTVTYVYAGSIRIASLTTQTTSTGTENNTLYYHGDHLGSSSIITDGSGTVVRNISYQPWGNVHTNTEESGATTLDPNRKFTGQILDDSTDLYYYGARYYDPVLRRFITPDTIVQSPYDPQSLNRYAYCRNNPLIYTDEDGHFFWIPIIVGAVMGGTHGNPFNHNNWENFDVGGALIGGAAGWAGGAAGSWAFESAGGGLSGLMSSGMVGGFAAGSVGGGLTTARYGGNVFEGAMMGGINGAAAGIFTSGFAAMGVTGAWGSAAGSWAGSYLMSGFSNPSGAWSAAGSAAAGSFLSASLNRFSPLDKSGRVPSKEEFANKDPRAIAFEKANSSYAAVGESADSGDFGWNFIGLTLGSGYSHIGHTQDGYPPYGRYYKFLEVDISPKPYTGRYNLFSNNCTTNYGYSHPGSYNANVSYEGSTYYLWRFYK